MPPASENAVEALYATGYYLFRRHCTAHALAVFRALVHLAPYDERGWLALGACYESQAQSDVALELYAAAKKIAQSAPRCQVARARILRERGHVLEARDMLAAAARTAEALQDDDLKALIASEWRKRR